MKKAVALMGLVWALSLPIVALASERGWKEGVDYKAIPPANGLKAGEVIEFFSYGCIHCYNFLPHLERIRQRLPEKVSLRLIPVSWSESDEAFARSYYAAQQLGVAQKGHAGAFNYAILTLRGKGSIEDMAGFYKGYGADPAALIAIANSPMVDSILNEDRKIYLRIGLKGTPAVVVNGRYITGDVESYEELEALTMWLIDTSGM